MAVSHPRLSVSHLEEEDDGGKSEHNRIEENDWPGLDRDAVGEPERLACSEDQIHPE